VWVHCSREEFAGTLTRKPGSETFAHRLDKPCRCGVQHFSGSSPVDRAVAARSVIVGTYDYLTAAGTLSYQAVRYEPKDFRQRRPGTEEDWVRWGRLTKEERDKLRAPYVSKDPGGAIWVWRLQETDALPYRLPELLAAPADATIYIPEGEKDVDRLRGRGMVATCNAGGAGKWRPEFSQYFTGRHVAILADNDEPGRHHVQQVADSLTSVAASVRVVHFPELPEHGDVSDWLDAGHTRAELEQRVATAPVIAPAHEPSAAQDAPGPVLPTLRGAQLRAMPRPGQIVEGVILDAPTCMLYARAGVGKTFMAMDLFLAIAADVPWHGHSVMAGPVLYIAAEGAYGIGQRYAAWCEVYNHGQDVEDFILVPQPVYPTVAETIETLRNTLKHLSVTNLRAIVLDTLSQCFNGGDENAQQDAQVFLTAITAIARELHTMVVAVHHSGWDETHPRGSTVLRGGIDTILKLKSGEDDWHFTLSHDKVKDLPPMEPLTFERVQVGNSCIIRPVGEQAVTTRKLTKKEREILEALETTSLSGATSGELMAAIGMAKTTFYRELLSLAKARLILTTGEARGADRTHTITQGGKWALRTGEIAVPPASGFGTQNGTQNGSSPSESQTDEDGFTLVKHPESQPVPPNYSHFGTQNGTCQSQSHESHHPFRGGTVGQRDSWLRDGNAADF
jgi:hypothetical protein